jgi:hypothetical protein
MKLQYLCRKAFVLAFALALVSFNAAYAVMPPTPEYSFKVTNKTKVAIKKLYASEDGKKYGFFDIGAGIGAGRSMTLVWDKSTDQGNCEQYFKAVFADGEESEPVVFDFCEEDLELVFD